MVTYLRRRIRLFSPTAISFVNVVNVSLESIPGLIEHLQIWALCWNFLNNLWGLGTE
jgi:hypothetical protein